jgi:hypothetical protein
MLPAETIPSDLTGETNSMTKEQQEDLLTEWSLYEPTEQRLMINEYRYSSEGNCNKDRFLDFLKEKLEIEGYWKKVGLA